LNAVAQIVKKALKRAEVCVSIISPRKVSIECVSNIMTIFSQRKHAYEWMPLTGEADVSRARSRVASAFLKTENDVLLFVDDDIRFKKEDSDKLIDNVVDGKLICGAHYVQKGTIDKTMVMEDGESILFHPNEKEPKKCVALPGGFVAFHRSAFEAVLKLKRHDGDPVIPLCNEGASWEFYPFFDSQPMKMDGGWRFIPEDWSMCLRAREAGVQSWVHPGIMLSHVGEAEFDFRDRLRQPKMSWGDFPGVTYA